MGVWLSCELDLCQYCQAKSTHRVPCTGRSPADKRSGLLVLVLCQLSADTLTLTSLLVRPTALQSPGSVFQVATKCTSALFAFDTF